MRIIVYGKSIESRTIDMTRKLLKFLYNKILNKRKPPPIFTKCANRAFLSVNWGTPFKNNVSKFYKKKKKISSYLLHFLDTILKNTKIFLIFSINIQILHMLISDLGKSYSKLCVLISTFFV